MHCVDVVPRGRGCCGQRGRARPRLWCACTRRAVDARRRRCWAVYLRRRPLPRRRRAHAPRQITIAVAADEGHPARPSGPSAWRLLERATFWTNASSWSPRHDGARVSCAFDVLEAPLRPRGGGPRGRPPPARAHLPAGARRAPRRRRGRGRPRRGRRRRARRAAAQLAPADRGESALWRRRSPASPASPLRRAPRPPRAARARLDPPRPPRPPRPIARRRLGVDQSPQRRLTRRRRGLRGDEPVATYTSVCFAERVGRLLVVARTLARGNRRR